ncbi:MAG: FecR domain-containing protein [Elusimicrobia bacterium]|nr:FecR domain-containing protein [Elusimicrobiota bacterium]
MRRRNNHRLNALFAGLAGPFLLLSTVFAEPIVVKSVRGNAEIHRSKSQANRWRALQKGASVKPGDTVRTGKNARLELKIDDGSRVVLGSKSRVQVAESAPSRIFNLAVGRIKSFVKKLQPESKFEIRTPLATAAVRGTVFEMGFDEEAKAGFLDVDRGVVALSQDGRALDVRAGQRMDFLTDVPLGEAPSRESRGSAAPSSEDLARDALRHEVGLGMSKEMVMAAAAEEIRAAEYQEGKTLMDVNGNRVRLEEYIIRNPAEITVNPDRAFKLVTLNERADRFDYFYYLGQFNQTLPTDLPWL